MTGPGCGSGGGIGGHTPLALPPRPGERCTDGKPHELFQRPDDNEETVRQRLAVYRERTQPLIDHFTKQGLLRRIDADGSLDDVDARLEAVLSR